MGFMLDRLYDGCRYLAEVGFRGKVILNYSLNAPDETEATLRDSIESYKQVAAILGEDRRSEEHTSELQSLAYVVCRLLLEKKMPERKTDPRLSVPKLNLRVDALSPEVRATEGERRVAGS